MDCRLFDGKPYGEPMLGYCQLDTWEYISVKFESKFIFIQQNAIENVVCQKCRPFCPGGDE